MPHPTPDLAVLANSLNSSRPLPPVDNWNPPLLGDIDLRIARDGVWRHEGTPIQREALVQLFASILRRDEDGHYYLVTPVEKWRIQVDDAPFLAIRVDATGAGIAQCLTFTTNVGDVVTAGLDHPLIVEYRTVGGEPAPYLHVRGRLRALLSRAVFLELAEQGEERLTADGLDYGVWSQGQFFSLGRLDETA
ncbi:MAG TPA: DUF1285 domain-containing protein [Gammaproteobacteria bacterium]|nr:DUF1285 domain-containing protein [Gammaproteobacteria bacterium]